MARDLSAHDLWLTRGCSDGGPRSSVAAYDPYLLRQWPEALARAQCWGFTRDTKELSHHSRRFLVHSKLCFHITLLFTE